jgi:hypothetical protein
LQQAPQPFFLQQAPQPYPLQQALQPFFLQQHPLQQTPQRPNQQAPYHGCMQ